jgi:UDP-glucose 4-epimerase
VSGDRYVTFDGLARACAVAAGKDPSSVKIVHYNPKQYDFGKRKAFPLRAQHFFCDITKAQRELAWQPQYDLVQGLTESFHEDYLASGAGNLEVDFSVDDEILGK